jgi:hypothetical protein
LQQQREIDSCIQAFIGIAEKWAVKCKCDEKDLYFEDDGQLKYELMNDLGKK